MTSKPARNLSQLPNNKTTVIEPRIVAVPGTIKDPGRGWTGIAEDKQNKNVFYVTYGTVDQPQEGPGDRRAGGSVPDGSLLQLFPGQGRVVRGDRVGCESGQRRHLARRDRVTGGITLAKGDPEQGEVQLRMTPDGSRFYAAGCRRATKAATSGSAGSCRRRSR